MEKITFINGQAPAINGTNLNKIQTNVENAINGVQANVNTLQTNIDTLSTNKLDKTQIASDTVLGLIKKGTGINVDANGVASVDMSALVEDITDSDVITFDSGVTFEGKKIYKILGKFIYLSCTGSASSGATTINIGTVTENYRPSHTVYAGGMGAASSHLAASVNKLGAIKTATTSSGNWFGFTLIWAIK